MKRYALDIRGKRHEWTFIILADPKYVQEWRDDGLKIDEVINTIPQWWVNIGLPVRLWCWMQDLFYKNGKDERERRIQLLVASKSALKYLRLISDVDSERLTFLPTKKIEQLQAAVCMAENTKMPMRFCSNCYGEHIEYKRTDYTNDGWTGDTYYCFDCEEEFLVEYPASSRHPCGRGVEMTTDYPTDIELQQIREWVMPDLHGLMGFIKSIWRYSDLGYWSMVNNVYSISTAGWSGNEEIITAMRENIMFWLLYWDSERRGGHYVFRDLHDECAGYPRKTEAAIRAAEEEP